MITRVLSGSDENLDLFVCTLRSGQPIALPTETVYGLAAPVTNEQALRAIFEIKGRPLHDPLIVHLHEFEELDKWAEMSDVDKPLLERLTTKFWPGPLTIILPKKTGIPDLVTAGLKTAAFRVPAHPVFREIIRRVGLPLAAPSANPFQYISPTRPAHVLSTLSGKIPYIVDGGSCDEGLESTIIDLSTSPPIVRRPGPIDRKAIEAVLGQGIKLETEQADGSPTKAVSAPGNFTKHYAPRKPGLRLNSSEDKKGCDHVIDFLELPSNPKELRRQFYDRLIAADQSACERIALINWPENLADEALSDRLDRALG